MSEKEDKNTRLQNRLLQLLISKGTKKTIKSVGGIKNFKQIFNIKSSVDLLRCLNYSENQDLYTFTVETGIPIGELDLPREFLIDYIKGFVVHNTSYFGGEHVIYTQKDVILSNGVYLGSIDYNNVQEKLMFSTSDESWNDDDSEADEYDTTDSELTHDDILIIINYLQDHNRWFNLTE
jgi:hypothetical protein